MKAFSGKSTILFACMMQVKRKEKSTNRQFDHIEAGPLDFGCLRRHCYIERENSVL